MSRETAESVIIFRSPNSKLWDFTTRAEEIKTVAEETQWRSFGRDSHRAVRGMASPAT